MRDFVLNAFAQSADGGPDTDRTTNTHTHDVKWRRNLAAVRRADNNEATRPAGPHDDPGCRLTRHRIDLPPSAAAPASLRFFYGKKIKRYGGRNLIFGLFVAAV